MAQGSAPKKSAGSRRRNRPSPRQRLLDSATNLFTTEGIRVIGIDRILREADVAKASLYSLFGSKDALVIAYLENLDEQYRRRWAERTEAMTDAEDKILAFFDLAIAEEPDKDFRGSHFQNASNEYPRPETESELGIIAACMAHRSQFPKGEESLQWLKEMDAEAGKPVGAAAAEAFRTMRVW